MQSVLADTRSAAAAAKGRRLRLIWKDPQTGRYSHIGWFDALADGRYSFSYAAGAVENKNFTHVSQYPDLSRTYVSESLPAFFANRVMNRRRPSYEQYIDWLGLTPDALPVEVMARTGGGRATDFYQLVEDLDLRDGHCEARFFVSGMRHVTPGLALLDDLQKGQELDLRDEPDNPVNERAVLLNTEGRPVGYVPDWMVNDVHRLRTEGAVRVYVDKVNPDAPARLAVLCRLVATRSS
jgi:hypothetical protein